MSYYQLSIQEQVLKFGQIFSTLGSVKRLCFVLGHQKAGKSLLIDVLSDKKIIQYNDIQLDLNMLVEQGNHAREYVLIYTNNYNQDILFIESLTLDQQKTIFKENIIKLFYLKQFPKIVQQISLILVIQQMQISSIILYLDHLLSLLNITTQKDKLFTKLCQSLILVISKSSENDVQSKIQQIKQVIEDDNQHQNAKIVLNFIIDKYKQNTKNINNQKIIQFPNLQPQSLGQKIRAKLTKVKFYQKNKQFLSINKQLCEKDVFEEKQQDQIMQLIKKILTFIVQMVDYAFDSKKPKAIYEKISKQLFPGHKNKFFIKTMIQKWDKSQLSKIQIQNINDKLNVQGDFVKLFQAFIQVLKSLEAAKETTREDFMELIGIVIFLGQLKPWLDQKLNNSLESIVQKFKKTVKTREQPQKQQKPAQNIPIKAAQKSVLKPKIPIKKPTAFTTFCTSINDKCKTNKQAFQFCCQKLQQKYSQQQKQFNYVQILYHIKLIRELLYNFTIASKQPIFISQIIQLYLLTQSYFQFQPILNYLIRQSYFTPELYKQIAYKFIKLKKYQYSDLVINQGLKNTYDDNKFQLLVGLKIKIQELINQQYYCRGEQDDKKDVIGQKVTNILTFKKEDLLNKIKKNNEAVTYFNKDSFKEIIGKKQ